MMCQSKKQAQDYKKLKRKHQDSQHTAEILLSFILGYMFRLICEPLSGLIYKRKQQKEYICCLKKYTLENKFYTCLVYKFIHV
jgi:hypothetical protein